MLCACHPNNNGNSDATTGDDGSNGDAPKPIDGSVDGPPVDGPPIDTPPGTVRIRTIFVIPFENKANTQIYGNTGDAPFLNGLLAQTAAHATKFTDELPNLDSEPHYIWMEAGTNVFADHTFDNDGDPSSGNSTNSTQHLVTQLEAAGIPWMAYQEDIASGTCPISGTGHYAPKHDPFVFFQDVSGSPPASGTTRCKTHHKSYADFPTDLAAGITGYVFITPNLCNDMHGDLTCPSFIFDGPNIKAGDTWLSKELPRLITFTQQHDDAVIFITWDEGDSTNLIPFLAIGQHVKGGHTSTVTYTHSSLLKSVEKLLGVPVLPTVTNANDFADMFQPGLFN